MGGGRWAVPGILDSDIDCRQGWNRVQIREKHDFFVGGMHTRFAIREWRHVVRTGRSVPDGDEPSTAVLTSP